ncbi:MAG: hypothetical protein A3G34_07470 [Candidatus Lindowbacteria bacterium RIFCSPLOWO2_12_FULL_62_27]|nr:MAG: hypothetical protein A3G34_07470 [Candidatus Lindowbacteria bacterium RIFCSPLOWO2_12_FULL_62_27]OGH62273.1 MAG: hypothetical protein A3I06_04960 [Candidatus Lindowbacteria bacterium RIFCSPLOWO2_02_FULL_62_12]
MSIPTEQIISLIHRYLKTSDTKAWSRFDDAFDWPNLSKSEEIQRLTDVQLAAVRTSLMIEDHIPGYATEYFRLFPVDDTVPKDAAWRNRNMLHFVFQWCAEEDRHAHVFETYLRATGRVDQEDLTREMIHEGAKKYHAPSDHFSLLFTYTMLQEKATQLYYQMLYRSVEEAPVLREVLKRLFQDEARHCSYFSDLVLLDLRSQGDELVAKIKTALDSFAMPMADLLDNYKRQAITMIRAARGYDHRSAFSQLDEIIRRYTESSARSAAYPLEDFFTAVPNFNPS